MKKANFSLAGNTPFRSEVFKVRCRNSRMQSSNLIKIENGSGSNLQDLPDNCISQPYLFSRARSNSLSSLLHSPKKVAGRNNCVEETL